jgi:L-lactate permease
MTLDISHLISGAIGSLFGAIGGGIIVLISSIVTQNRNWKNQQKREKEKQITKEKEIQNRFFMELNYNKRKIIYTIENENYKLTSLDNLHWKNFIYSNASRVLLKDKELIDELATLDSMIDQANDRIQSINKSETAIIFSSDPEMKNINKRLTLSLKEYAKKELKPQLEKVITRLEKLFKNL